MAFRNRLDAGKQLCKLLEKYKGQKAVVYAIPRGGVTVGAPIAKYLNAPLDLLLAHKIGHPYSPEYAIAAVSESGHVVGNQQELRAVDPDWLENAKKNQIQEIKRKRQKYLKDKAEIPVQDCVAIVVDDGIATGLTLQAGIQEILGKHPLKVVVAVPVAPRRTADLIKKTVDDFVAVKIPEDEDFLGSVGAYYSEFDQVEDDEVLELLERDSG